jgi:hypothetical protein
MGWKVVARDANGEERYSREMPTKEAALLQACYDREHGASVLRVDGPDALTLSIEDIKAWRKANPGK